MSAHRWAVATKADLDAVMVDGLSDESVGLKCQACGKIVVVSGVAPDSTGTRADQVKELLLYQAGKTDRLQPCVEGV